MGDKLPEGVMLSSVRQGIPNAKPYFVASFTSPSLAASGDTREEAIGRLMDLLAGARGKVTLDIEEPVSTSSIAAKVASLVNGLFHSKENE